MSKQPAGSVYIGNNINYLTYLPFTFPRGLEVDLEGSSTFPTLILSVHIDRLGLFSHFYRYFFNCITTWQGIWVGTTALCIEVRWRCTMAIFAWCSVHQLTGCEGSVKVS